MPHILWTHDNKESILLSVSIFFHKLLPFSPSNQMEPKVELTFNPLMLVPGIQLYKHGVKNKLPRKYEIIYKYRKLSIEKRYFENAVSSISKFQSKQDILQVCRVGWNYVYIAVFYNFFSKNWYFHISYPAFKTHTRYSSITKHLVAFDI